MYREILVPLDGSELAERALPYATMLARTGRAHLRLIRVVPFTELTPALPPYTFRIPESSGDPEKAQLDAEAYLNGILSQSTGDSSVDSIVFAGDAASMIAEEARSRSVDLIVMSTKGRSALQEWMHGSVAGDVIRGSSVPVLVIPRGCERRWSAQGHGRLLVLLDGSPLSQEILTPALDLSQTLGTELILLRVIAPSTYENVIGYPLPVAIPAQSLGVGEAEGYLNSIASELRKVRPRISTNVIEANDPVAAVLSFALDQNVDAIAMATHGRGGLARLVMGSIARGVLHQAVVPTLMFRPSALRHADA